MNGPRSLKDVLAGWTPRGTARGGSTPDDLAAAAFAAAWEQAVGPEIARRSRPAKFRGGVLTVLTASSTWSDELSLHAPKILAALRRSFADVPLHKLRFMVASGRTKLLLDGERARVRPAAAARPAASSKTQTRQPSGDDLTATIARLAAMQAALDAERDRAGWTTCASCGRRFLQGAHTGNDCAPCAEEKRRKKHGAIERALVQAPWLSLADVRRDLPATSTAAYERTRSRLLARWQSDIEAAQRRLRRGATTPPDRVVAWSYLMLATGVAQRDLGRAVVEGMLGREWTGVLFGDVAVQKQEARRSPRENQKR